MVSKQDLEKYYTEMHLTMSEIGGIYNVSRARISQLCKAHGIIAEQGERVTITCDRCGKHKIINRRRFRKHSTHYCSMQCYLSDRKNMDYRPHRNGQREARRVMAAHIGRSLTKEEVVHHIDGNCQNNALHNLVLFPNHSAHIRWHHAQRLGV